MDVFFKHLGRLVSSLGILIYYAGVNVLAASKTTTPGQPT